MTVFEELISESEGFSAARAASSSSDVEEEVTAAAGADLRRGVILRFVDVLAEGRGGLKAGRPRFAGTLELAAGIIGWLSYEELFNSYVKPSVLVPTE